MNLLRTLATVSSLTLVSRILGYVRDFIIARAAQHLESFFGAGDHAGAAQRRLHRRRARLCRALRPARPRPRLGGVRRRRAAARAAGAVPPAHGALAALAARSLASRRAPH